MENATFKISTLALTFLDSTGKAQALQGSAKMDLRVSRPPDAHEPQRLMFTLLESGETGSFAEQHVITVSCGYTHTMAVTKDGSLFTWGTLLGGTVMLGYNSNEHQPLPGRMNPALFDSKVVSACAGRIHSAVVTHLGTLYTWGNVPDNGRMQYGSAGGTAQEITKHVPTNVTISRFTNNSESDDMRIGCCHNLLPEKIIAFAMGTHHRLGGGWSMHNPPEPGSRNRKSQRQQGKDPAVTTLQRCHFFTMPADLVQRVVQACASWPQGPAGKTEGIVRLLGGGLMTK